MKISLIQLIADLENRLPLSAVLPIDESAVMVRKQGQYSSELIGHFNHLHPGRLQVIGALEWQVLSQDTDGKELREVLAHKPLAIILAERVSPTPSFIEWCADKTVPLLQTDHPSAGVIDILRTYLSRRLADTVTMSGVFLDVLGLGVLITGESGLGKSELGLELITRGHGLVADDVTELAQVSPYSLEGRCPDMLRDFLEVRGLGILNVRLIFGETAIRRKMRLKLIINLLRLAQYQEMPRLPAEEVETILGVGIRRVNLPVSAGRNLAVLVEAAVRDTILKLRGFTPSAELIRRHANLLYSSREPLPDVSSRNTDADD